MSNPWTKLVQEKFRLGRMSNPVYSLKQAMKSAKQVYKKGVHNVSSVVSNTRKRRRSTKHRRTKGRR